MAHAGRVQAFDGCEPLRSGSLHSCKFLSAGCWTIKRTKRSVVCVENFQSWSMQDGPSQLARQIPFLRLRPSNFRTYSNLEGLGSLREPPPKAVRTPYPYRLTRNIKPTCGTSWTLYSEEALTNSFSGIPAAAEEVQGPSDHDDQRERTLLRRMRRALLGTTAPFLMLLKLFRHCVHGGTFRQRSTQLRVTWTPFARSCDHSESPAAS